MTAKEKIIQESLYSLAIVKGEKLIKEELFKLCEDIYEQGVSHKIDKKIVCYVDQAFNIVTKGEKFK